MACKVDFLWKMNWSHSQPQQPAVDRSASSRLIVKLLIVRAVEKKTAESSALIYNWN